MKTLTIKEEKFQPLINKEKRKRKKEKNNLFKFNFLTTIQNFIN